MQCDKNRSWPLNAESSVDYNGSELISYHIVFFFTFVALVLKTLLGKDIICLFGCTRKHFLFKEKLKWVFKPYAKLMKSHPFVSRVGYS